MSEQPVVVVGADGTTQNEGALHAAIGLAERLAAELHVVHALDGRDDDEGAEARAADALRVWLAGHLAGARLETLEPAPKLVVSRGHPGRVLVDHAREASASLLVLGEHRRRGLLDFGSTAAAVTAHASCPVWCQVGPVREVREILVPIDFSPESDRAVELALGWASRFGASLMLLHVFQPPELLLGDDPHPVGPTYVVDQARDDARQELADWAEARDFAGVAHDTRFVEGDPCDGIVGHLGDADLVVMGTHGRTGLSAALLGSSTRAVLRACPIPVAVTRAGDDARAWKL